MKLFLSFLFSLISIAGFSQRQVDDGTKLVKSDAISLITELYHSYFVYKNDFLSTVNTATGGDDIVATNSGTGAATSAQATNDAGRVGLVRSTTGTTATGRTSVNTGSSAVRLGGGAWVYEKSFNIITTSNSTERYQYLVGFFDAYTAANQVDGVYFLYDEGGVSTGSTASVNWQCVTTSNSTRTFTNTATAVTQGTWVTLRIEVNAAANQVVFKVNGTTVATHTTNIPSGSGRETGFGWLLIKSVGTTARTVDVDYLSAISALTTTR
jgi:hypothetical protein